MEKIESTQPTRMEIGIRLLYTLLYLVVFEILKIVVQVTVVFQFIYLLITRNHSEPLRRFSNKVATYTYQIIRYMTLGDNRRPFPFKDFPAEMEGLVEDIRFN